MVVGSIARDNVAHIEHVVSGEEGCGRNLAGQEGRVIGVVETTHSGQSKIVADDETVGTPRLHLWQGQYLAKSLLVKANRACGWAHIALKTLIANV